MASVNLRTVFAFAREMHSKNPNIGNISYGERDLMLQCWQFNEIFRFFM